MSYYDKHDDTTALDPTEVGNQELKALLIAEWMARPDLPAIKAQLAQAKKRSSSALVRRKLQELQVRETQEI
ncbi:hypothetical protein [Pantoea brenneri]|uniref:hypothetical protein n=1 Tax=Pantoea brenneri TaxID=472694 RepID=UPI002449DA38|nr:hypothetical protein [Pantoea brenneri]MDH1088561.1 hypothetical protein [Pantoea brenneri]